MVYECVQLVRFWFIYHTKRYMRNKGDTIPMLKSKLEAVESQLNV